MTFRLSSGAKDVAVMSTQDYSRETTKWLHRLRSQSDGSDNDAQEAELRALTAFSKALPDLGPHSTISMGIFVEALGKQANDSEDSSQSLDHVREIVGFVHMLTLNVPMRNKLTLITTNFVTAATFNT